MDLSQRGAEVMGHGVVERLQLFVNGGELRRAQTDSLFELTVELTNLLFCLAKLVFGALESRDVPCKQQEFVRGLKIAGADLDVEYFAILLAMLTFKAVEPSLCHSRNLALHLVGALNANTNQYRNRQ